VDKIAIITGDSESMHHWVEVLQENYSLIVDNNLDKFVSNNLSEQGNNLALTIIDTQLFNGIEHTTLIPKIYGKKVIVGRLWPEKKQIEAIVAGVWGYAEIAMSSELICRVVNSVLNDEIWLQRHLIPRVIQQLTLNNSSVAELIPPGFPAEEKKRMLASLSKRELDVAEMISRGDGNKKIAKNLYITERTVKAHLTSIFKKLNVPDRIQLIIFLRSSNM
jgi:two-component system, NarL family, nitrate/nitrite response regulator NarL